MPPSLRSVDEVLYAARQFAAAGWRPTHQEIQQLVALIDRQAEQLARQPLGYLVASEDEDGLFLTGDTGAGPVALQDAVVPFLAPPAPMEFTAADRVVAVYEVPA
jgi:hypothetical protein